MPDFDEINLQEYKKAVEEEFQANEKTSKRPIADLEELRPAAYEAISYTLKHSANESLRTRTGMWVLDKLLDHATREEDKVLEFLKGMPTAQETPVEPS